MAVLAVTLLALGVSGTIARPWRLPGWLFPVAAAAAALAVGALEPSAAWEAVDPLVEPIVFLLLAVPLAVVLDELGVFDAAARLTAGRHLAAGMWVVCAVAVATLNLDAAVVLCTPLAITVARRWGVDPVAFSFQPALLACLASSALPVSNLTNLIAVADGWVGATELTARLGLPTLAACIVGYAGWRLAFRGRPLTPTVVGLAEPVPRRPLVIGAAVLAVLVVGFVAGPLVGIPAWVVVLATDVVLVLVRRRVPWTAIPWGTAGVAVGLAVVAAAASERLGLAERFATGDVWRQALVGAAAANVVNNLPAFLLVLPHAGGTDQVLALLLGVNAGPTVLVTGSLAGLLWLESARRGGLSVGPVDYARVGLVAGVPALLAAVAVLTMTS